MKLNRNSASIACRLLGGAALGAMMAGDAFAQSIADADEIVVTAQRQEESVQDVPIAVSAFGGEDLQDRQLESFQDIQFNIPNFSFSRSNFTGSTIVLRGIGALAVGSSTEPSVSIHLNDFFLSAPRLFETEFFDIERLEILRGPQGTLFGRNATGGVINVITAKASPDAVGGYIDAEYGNYNAVKLQGALNLPLNNRLAVRLAGTTIQRGGYTENLFDGSDIDDRDIHALRASARWLPTDNTTVDFTASYMREDDSRLRSQKQACASGPLSPLLGCDPNGPRRFDRQDLRASFLSNASAETLGALFGSLYGSSFGANAANYGLVSLANPIFGAAQPTDIRQVNQDTQPQYDAEETIFQVNLKHDFESFSVKFNGGWGNSKIASRQDFDAGVGPTLFVTGAPALGRINGPVSSGGIPGVAAFLGNTLPLSNFDVGISSAQNGLVGSINNNNQARSSNYRSADLSIGETDYWSVESIINSDFDGRFNFLLGARHDKSNGFADYGVATSSLDYFSILGGTLLALGEARRTGCATFLAGGGAPSASQLGQCGAPFDAQSAGAQAAGNGALQGLAASGAAFGFFTPYFFNDTDDNFLRSTSAFGEIYFDITDKLKLTGGVRRNFDTKGLRDRGNVLDGFADLVQGTLPVGATPIVPLGTPSVRALLDSNEAVEGTTGAITDFRVIEDTFNSTTGRAVLQYTPSDDVQIYASWTRGFKSGGFNPRTGTGTVPLTFEPEVINAYELGVKSNLFGNRLQANLTGFYYDYSGLQVARVVSNTTVNDNIDATVWGIEGEFVYKPFRNLVANLNASYLNTSIGEFSTFDPRNPTAGAANAELVRDVILSTNCVVTRNAGAAPLLIPNGGAPLGGPFASLNALIGLSPSLGGLGGAPNVGAFSICSQLTSNIGNINLATGGTRGYAVVGGVDQDLQGNELPGAPSFKVAGGVQYTWDLGGWQITPRADAFYQNEFFTNVFNTEQDQVSGYAYVNTQVKFQPRDAQWSLRFFMQNVTNNESITGTFDVGQGAGNFQNLFYLEPRRWGFGANFNF